MITDVDLVKWLKSPSAIRCVLMEAGVLSGGVETTRYLSNKGYVTGPSNNLLPSSENIATKWTPNGNQDYVSNYGIAPDGTKTSTLASSGGTVYLQLNLTQGETYVYSIFVKAGSASTYLLYADGAALNAAPSANFNVTTGAQLSLGNAISSKSTQYPNGWWRLEVVFVAHSTGSGAVHIYPNGVAGQTVEVWGAQLEKTSTSLGSELVTNGTFASDVSGWSQTTGATISFSNGKLRVTTDNAQYGYQIINTEVGKKYLFSVSGATDSNGDASYVKIGSALGSKTTYCDLPLYSARTLPVAFMATSTTTVVSFNPTVGTGRFSEFDNVSLREITSSTNASTYVASTDTFVSRASVGTYLGEDGLVKLANINEPRVQYSPLYPEARGKLLVEGAVTNLLSYTERFEKSAAWLGGMCTVIGNSAVAPDGTLTAATVTRASGTGGNWSDLLQNVLVGAGSNVGKSYTASVWLWVPSGTASVYLGISDAFYTTSMSSIATVTTTPQRFTFTSNGSPSGWNAAGTYIGFGLFFEAGKPYYVWGAQLEASPQTIGAEKVINGTFDSNVTSWTASNSAILTHVSGQLEVKQNAAGVYGQANQTVTGLIVGKPYRFNFKIVTGTATHAIVQINGVDYGAQPAGVYSKVFTATSTTAGITLALQSSEAVGKTILFDDVSVKEIVPSSSATSYIPSRDTFTSRASTGTYIGSDGLIKTAAINVPRMSYNPLNLSAPSHLLLEAAATNLLIYSQQFSNGNWTKYDINLSDSVAPDGTSTATVATPYGTDAHMWQGVTLGVGTYVFSLYLKGEGSSVGKSPWVWAWYGGTAVGSHGEDRTPLTSEWRRYSCTFTVTTAGTLQVRCDFIDPSIVGNKVHVWGAQLEQVTPYYGAELVTNSGFASSTGWTLTGTSSISGGSASIPESSSVRQAIATVAGKTYTVSFDITTASNKGVARAGTTAGGSDIYSSPSYIAVTGKSTFTFIAGGATTHITVLNDITPSATLVVDNISVCELVGASPATSYIPTTAATVTRAADIYTSPAETRAADVISSVATVFPTNLAYSPVIGGGVKFTESLSLDGSPSLSFGDIELLNPSGDRDSWLDDIWTNRNVKVFIGDPSWPRSDFYKIFDGVSVGIDSRRRDRINLKLSDKMQRLNTPVSEQLLGGVTANKDKLIPLCFGECHNVEPLLVDPNFQEYQVHNGPIEDIIEVRDNGVPVSITKLLSTGKFRLNQAPVGQITCSVQGDKTATYSTNIVELIRRLCMRFGTAANRLVAGDLDTASLAAFEAANTQPVGLYLSDRTNVVDACNRLATSVGARVYMNRAGLLSIVKIDLPQAFQGTLITPSDMVNQSLSVSQLPPVTAAVKIGYCRNHAVQNNLQTGIPSKHIALFAEEWLTSTKSDAAAATNYKINVQPVMAETLLLTEADADAEALRRLNLFKVQRKVFQYKGLGHLLTEKLGASQTITHPRFGLSNGGRAQIISLTSDWLDPHVDVEILI